MRDDLYRDILGAEGDGIVLTDVGRAYMRDRFAMHVLGGVMTSATGLGEMTQPQRAVLLQRVAAITYEVADAMLTERERAK